MIWSYTCNGDKKCVCWIWWDFKKQKDRICNQKDLRIEPLHDELACQIHPSCGCASHKRIFSINPIFHLKWVLIIKGFLDQSLPKTKSGFLFVLGSRDCWKLLFRSWWSRNAQIFDLAFEDQVAGISLDLAFCSVCTCQGNMQQDINSWAAPNSMFQTFVGEYCSNCWIDLISWEMICTVIRAKVFLGVGGSSSSSSSSTVSWAAAFVSCLHTWHDYRASKIN
jgi:hypothetical protein